MAKLTEKSRKVWEYVRDNDYGDGVSMEELAAGVGMEIKQIGPLVWNVLKAKKDGSRPTLVTYEKRVVEGQPKPVGYAHITEEGKVYVDVEEETAE